MSAYNMRGIPAMLIEHMWGFAEPYVKRALDHANGELTANDLKQACLDRAVQLWLVSEGALVIGAATTEVVVYPHKKHCRIITIAGSNFPAWMPLVDATLVEWGVELGCDALEAHVRRGLVPKLAPLGYKHLHSVVVKNLVKPAETQGE